MDLCTDHFNFFSNVLFSIFYFYIIFWCCASWPCCKCPRIWIWAQIDWGFEFVPNSVTCTVSIYAQIEVSLHCQSGKHVKDARLPACLPTRWIWVTAIFTNDCVSLCFEILYKFYTRFSMKHLFAKIIDAWYKFPRHFHIIMRHGQRAWNPDQTNKRKELRNCILVIIFPEILW